MPARKQKTSSISLQLFVSFALAFLVLFTFLEDAHASAANNKIRIAILPCRDITATYISAQPLKLYLENKIHAEIELLVPNSLNEFKRIVQAGEADFALQAPHVYILLAEFYDQELTLQSLNPHGVRLHQGVFITRRDSGINEITDLHDKVVLFGHPFSTAKWVAATALLRKEGIDPDKDLKKYSHGGSCESIALNIYLGQADAGIICDYAFEDLIKNASPQDDEIPPDALISIGTTEFVPAWVFSTRQGINNEIAASVSNALINLDHRRPDHMEIMEKLDLGGFTHARLNEFELLKKNLIQPELTSP